MQGVGGIECISYTKEDGVERILFGFQVEAPA